MESSSVAVAPLLNDALFKTLIDSFFNPILACITTLGILGNVLNIMIFRKRTPMDVMTTCFVALAVSDLLYFCFYVPNFISEAFAKNGMQILNNVDIHSLVLFTMVYQKSLFNKISITITAFMSFERSLCVVKPFLVKTLFTRRRVVIILTAIYLCLIAVFTPALLSAEAVWKYPWNKTEPVLMFQPTSLRVVADYISSLVTGFSLIVVTQVIITISAGLMISDLRRHQHFRQTASSEPEMTRHLGKKTSRGSSKKAENEIEPSCADEQSERKVALPDPNSQEVNSSSKTINPAETATSKELRLIKTVLALAVMHVILTFPSLVFFVAQNLIPELGLMRKYSNMFYLGAKIITISNSLNGMLSTFVYLTLNERYKIQFKKLFCCGKFNK